MTLEVLGGLMLPVSYANPSHALTIPAGTKAVVVGNKKAIVSANIGGSAFAYGQGRASGGTQATAYLWYSLDISDREDDTLTIIDNDGNSKQPYVVFIGGNDPQLNDATQDQITGAWMTHTCPAGSNLVGVAMAARYNTPPNISGTSMGTYGRENGGYSVGAEDASLSLGATAGAPGYANYDVMVALSFYEAAAGAAARASALLLP